MSYDFMSYTKDRKNKFFTGFVFLFFCFFSEVNIHAMPTSEDVYDCRIKNNTSEESCLTDKMLSTIMCKLIKNISTNRSYTREQASSFKLFFHKKNMRSGSLTLWREIHCTFERKNPCSLMPVNMKIIANKEIVFPIPPNTAQFLYISASKNYIDFGRNMEFEIVKSHSNEQEILFVDQNETPSTYKQVVLPLIENEAPQAYEQAILPLIENEAPPAYEQAILPLIKDGALPTYEQATQPLMQNQTTPVYEQTTLPLARDEEYRLGEADEQQYSCCIISSYEAPNSAENPSVMPLVPRVVLAVCMYTIWGLIIWGCYKIF